MNRRTRATLTAATMALAGLLAGCGGGAAKKAAQADARAAASGFVPPSVTSRSDYGGAIQRRFGRLDRDADGYVTPAEWTTPRLRFADFDTDRDGRVSSDEFGHTLLARFDRMDLNHDGSVTSEERRESGAAR